MAELGWSEGGGAVTVPGGPRPSLEDVGAELLFEKVLTSCDAASHGRIVLPKKAAIEHFACQDGKVGLTVHCEDTFGNEHTILHRFWTNAKSRMYLLEGLERMLRVYKVAPGDVLVFGLLPSGKMVVCARLPRPDDVQRTRRSANAVGAAAEQPAKAKQPSAPAVATRRQKRARLLERAASVDSESSQEGADYFQPPPDGVFRAVPPGASYPLEPQVSDHGCCWSASVDIGGELFQAFFDSAAGAFDAFIAAGHDLPPELAAAAAAFENEQQAADAEQAAGESDAGELAADYDAEQPYGDAEEAADDYGGGYAATDPGVSGDSRQADQASGGFYAADEADAGAAAEPQEQLPEAHGAAGVAWAAAGGGDATAAPPAADANAEDRSSAPTAALEADIPAAAAAAEARHDIQPAHDGGDDVGPDEHAAAAPAGGQLAAEPAPAMPSTEAGVQPADAVGEFAPAAEAMDYQPAADQGPPPAAAVSQSPADVKPESGDHRGSAADPTAELIASASG